MRRSRCPAPFHISCIILICVIPVLATWFLIPRELEMAERLADDGHPYRALSILKELVPREIAPEADAEYGSWEFPAMEALFARDGLKRTRGGKKTRMLRVLLQVSNEPERAFELFRNDPDALAPSVARDFFDIMATTALRQNKPSLASEIYECLEETHGLTDTLMMKTIQAHRFSGSPRPALDLLYEHAKRKGLEVTGLSREMRMMVISMHRELNEGAEAFALLKYEFSNAKTDIQRQDLIDLLATTAAQSNLFEESLPILLDHVSKTEAAQMSWEELAARQAPHPTDADFVKYSTTLAQQFLWSGNLHESLNRYCKLALLDNEEALANCVMIAPWVNRVNDIGTLLAALKTLPPGKGYERLLISTLCQQGKFTDAETRLRGWIRDGHENESEMRQALADLVFEQRRYDEARDLYEVALASRMKDPTTAEVVESLASLARTAAIAGDFEKALEHYRHIPIDQHTPKTMGDYQYLATSLNSNDDIIRGLEIEMKRAKKKTSQIYLSMANAYEMAGDLDASLEWLDKGLEAFPESRKVVLNSVGILKKQGRFNDALEYLYTNFTKGDCRFESELMNLAVSTQRQKEVLKFLDLSDPQAKSWPATLRFSLAEVYESNLEYADALAIYEDISPDAFETPKMRLRAQIAFLEGRIRDAWSLQTAYLELIHTPNHYDLVFMGDLHRMTGRTMDAANAYNAALVYLNRSISLDSAAFNSASYSPREPEARL